MKSILQYINEALIKKDTKLRTNKYDFIDLKNLKDGDIFYGVWMWYDEGDEIAVELPTICKPEPMRYKEYKNDVYGKNLYELYYHYCDPKKGDPLCHVEIHKTNIQDNIDGKIFFIGYIKNFDYDYVDDMMCCFNTEESAQEFIDNFESKYQNILVNYFTETNIFHKDD